MTTYSVKILNDPSATGGTFAQGINDSGQVVGYYNDSQGSHGFLLNGATYSTFACTTQSSRQGTNGYYQSQTVSTAEGINDSGQISGSGFFDYYGEIGQYGGGASVYENFDSAYDGFSANITGSTWANIQAPINGVVQQGTPSPVKTYGYGINSAGDVVGYYTDLGGDHGFLAPNGQPNTNIVEFNYPGVSGATYARGVNDSDQVVGYFLDSNKTAHGFLYVNGGFSKLDDPAAVKGTYAEGVNNLDQIVGYYVDGSGFEHGFIFNEPTGAYSSLDVTGATNTVVTGINNEGQLVGYYVDSSGTHGFVATPPNPGPPAGTSADMIMSQASTGSYEIYDLGNNAVLAGYPLTQIASPWQVAGLGNFSGTDTSDMLLRNPSTGSFEIVDVSNNNAGAPLALGNVGLNWQVAGFGDFSSRAGETDMLLRDSNTGNFELYDFGNNGVTYAAALGNVGLNFKVLGFGDFAGKANETDMLMRDSNTGLVELYEFSNNAVVSAKALGNLGFEWQFTGVGDFSSRPGETDLLMRDVNNGNFELYDFQNGAVTSATALGNVGQDWQVAGFADFSGRANETDMLMRNVNTGNFELYDFQNGAVVSATALGNVGTDWQVAGIAPYQAGGATMVSSASLLASSAAPTELQGVTDLLNASSGAAAGAQVPTATFAANDAGSALGASLFQHS